MVKPIVIKAQTLCGAARPVIKKEIHFSQRHAEEILSNAHIEAERVLELADRQSASVLESARQEGYATGLAEWHEILINAWKSHDDLLLQGERELVQLSLRIARKIIGEELKTNGDAILGIVREALRSVPRARTLVIQVSPEDEFRVREKAESFRSALSKTAEITVVSDPAVAPGGCIVESDMGIVDARVETQLKSLEQAVLGIVKR